MGSLSAIICSGCESRTDRDPARAVAFRKEMHRVRVDELKAKTRVGALVMHTATPSSKRVFYIALRISTTAPLISTIE
jgi:hypothetical protein